MMDIDKFTADRQPLERMLWEDFLKSVIILDQLSQSSLRKKSLEWNATKTTRQNRKHKAIQNKHTNQNWTSSITFNSHDIIVTTKYLKNCSSILEVGKRSHYFLVYILNWSFPVRCESAHQLLNPPFIGKQNEPLVEKAQEWEVNRIYMKQLFLLEQCQWRRK